MSTSAKLYFMTGRNERVQTRIHIEPDERSAVVGQLRDHSGKPLEGSLVLLFDGDAADSAPIAQSFTDEDGHFYFGPLAPDRLHTLKLFVNNTDLRELDFKSE